jgi:WD40 repeat protein
MVGKRKVRSVPFVCGPKAFFVLMAFFVGIYPFNGVADDFFDLLESREKYIPTNIFGDLSVACSKNGKYYGGATGTKRLVIRKISDGSVVKDIKSKRLEIHSLEFDPGSENIAIGYSEGVLGIQGLYGEEKERYVDLPLGRINDIEYSSDGKYLAAVGFDKVTVLNVEDLSEIYTVSDTSIHKAISVNKDSTLLAVGKSRGVTLLDFKSGAEIQHLGNSDVFSLGFGDDGRLLAFDYVRYGVVWDLEDSRLSHSITDPVLNRIAISSDGSILSIGGINGVVRQIDLQSQTELNHIVAPGGSVSSMMRCGEQYLVTGHSYNIMNVLDVMRGRIVRSHNMEDSDYLKNKELMRKKYLNRMKQLRRE